jgi:hypothetical protein
VPPQHAANELAAAAAYCNQRHHIRFDDRLVYSRSAGRRDHGPVRIQQVDVRNIVTPSIGDALQRRHVGG